MHMRGFVVFLLILSGGARRIISVDDSHRDAQHQNKLANGLWVSGEAREALLPNILGTSVFRRAGPRPVTAEPEASLAAGGRTSTAPSPRRVVRRAREPMAVVTEVSSSDELNDALASAGDSLVVLEFSAGWCGPCKVIAPKYEEFSNIYENVAFLKVMADSSKEAEQLVRSQGVRALPTFHFLKNNEIVEKLKGARMDAVRSTIEANM